MTDIEHIRQVMREAAGIAASSQLDAIQIPHAEGMDEMERLAIQRMTNTVFHFLDTLSKAVGDPAKVSLSAIAAVGVLVASRCPPAIKERFIDTLCDQLRSNNIIVKEPNA